MSEASVRFDANIPEVIATRLKEIATIENLVAEHFNDDTTKVALGFALANPMLGNLSLRNLIRAGRSQSVLNFVMEAREEERATEGLSEAVREVQQAQRHNAQRKKVQ